MTLLNDIGPNGMKSTLIPISPLYRRAIFDALVLQAIIGTLALMVLDLGQCAQICGIALLAFWGGATTLIARRPRNPTRTDIELIRGGYLIVIPVVIFLAGAIWRMRGF